MKIIKVELSDRLHKLVQFLAKRSNKTMSQYVAGLIEEEIEREDLNPKVTYEEFEEALPEFIDSCLRQGIEDPKQITSDFWLENSEECESIGIDKEVVLGMVKKKIDEVE